MTKLATAIPSDLWLDNRVMYRFADATGTNRGHAVRKIHILGKIIDAVSVGERGHQWQLNMWRTLPAAVGQVGYRGSFNRVDLNARDFAALLSDPAMRQALLEHGLDYTPNIDQFCTELANWLAETYRSP